MKRLILCNADGIINAAVLECFGVAFGEEINIANPDQQAADLIMQELLRAVKERHSDFDDELERQFVAVVIRYIMHIQPEFALTATQYEKHLNFFHNIVDYLREKFTKQYAGSSMANEEIYRIIVREMLGRLEYLFF